MGVTRDFRQEGLDREPEPEIYFDYRQVPDAMGEAIASLGVVLRFDSTSRGLLDSVKAAVLGLDPELPLADVRTMEARLEESVARPRLYAVLLSFFAAFALVVAVTGVGSVVSYQAAERTRENGLRMALGATSSDILGLTLQDGFRILGLGLALRLGGAFYLSRSLSSVLPARRASLMDPMKALRYE